MRTSKPIQRNRKYRNAESGYTLLMAVFLVATMLILSAAVTPNLLTQGRREREEDMVWRGEQYQRAIGLYFQKFGRYPTKIEDLTRLTNGVRFLRQPYPDPMNKDDGSWRFIYVGPNGQLIGSVRSQSLLQSALNMPSVSGFSLPGAAGQPPPPPGLATSGAAVGQFGQQTTPQSGQQQGQSGQQVGAPTGTASTPDSLQSQPQPLSGDVIGGNIIGVGSKVKEPSLRVYNGGDTYEEWEFIWNPMQQVGIPGQTAPGVPGAPAVPGQALPQNQQLPPGTQSPSTTPPSMVM